MLVARLCYHGVFLALNAPEISEPASYADISRMKSDTLLFINEYIPNLRYIGIDYVESVLLYSYSISYLKSE